MNKPLLNNPNIFPSDNELLLCLGKTKQLFDDYLRRLGSEYPDIITAWKYYNDGKTWLMNASRKKKTVFWLSVWDGYFTIAFYFKPAAEHDIMNGDFSELIKQQFAESAGKHIRGIALKIHTHATIEMCHKLLQLKLTFL